jgi:hypothetical protein
MTDIDPITFGRMQAEVHLLRSEVATLQSDVKELLALANKGKGGFWMGMTIASMMGALVSWIATHWPSK